MQDVHNIYIYIYFAPNWVSTTEMTLHRGSTHLLWYQSFFRSISPEIQEIQAIQIPEIRDKVYQVMTWSERSFSLATKETARQNVARWWKSRVLLLGSFADWSQHRSSRKQCSWAEATRFWLAADSHCERGAITCTITTIYRTESLILLTLTGIFLGYASFPSWKKSNIGWGYKAVTWLLHRPSLLQ